VVSVAGKMLYNKFSRLYGRVVQHLQLVVRLCVGGVRVVEFGTNEESYVYQSFSNKLALIDGGTQRLFESPDSA